MELNSASKVEKRNRPPLSCEPCRVRKLKCDRKLPCDTCTKRKKLSSCCYASNANRSKANTTPKLGASDLDERLKRMENLISSLIPMLVDDRNPQKSGPVPQANMNTEMPTASLRSNDISNDYSNLDLLAHAKAEIEAPHLYQHDGEAVYTQPNHWLSILQDIKEIRSTLSNAPLSSLESTPRNEQLPGPSPDLSFGLHDSNLKVEDVLVSLPPQPMCDILLSHYFNSRYMVLGIIHPPKFQKEYEEFWTNPSMASPLWIGLLFSILSIAVSLKTITTAQSDEGHSVPSAAILQQRSAQCLLLGGYLNAQENVLEALLLCLQSCFISQTKPPTQLWSDLGVVIRLAFRMGYHRDPSGFTNMSAFQSEMRRRVWIHIFQVDTLVSFYMGLPSMIPSDFCDTQIPRNLDHRDLHLDMKVLPQSRPLSEYTPLRHAIAKVGLMSIFKKVITHTQSLVPPDYAKTIALDSELREKYETLPDTLKRRNVSQSFMDSADLILERCTLELIYLKSIIVLHRRNIQKSPGNSHFEASRRFCIDAALEVLARHSDIHQASLPGGRLFEDRWMMSTLSIHDFLLAAMVICLDLSVQMEARGMSSIDTSNHDSFTIKKINALQTFREGWSTTNANSAEFTLGLQALDLMIQKASLRYPGILNHMESISEPEPHSPIESRCGAVGLISNMIDGSDIIDWTLLDQLFQDQIGATDFSDFVASDQSKLSSTHT